jgi:hypothetical protein
VWLFRNQTYYLQANNLTGFTATPSDSLENLRVAGLK